MIGHKAYIQMAFLSRDFNKSFEVPSCMSKPFSLQGHQLGDDPLKFGDGQ